MPYWHSARSSPSMSLPMSWQAVKSGLRQPTATQSDSIRRRSRRLPLTVNGRAGPVPNCPPNFVEVAKVVVIWVPATNLLPSAEEAMACQYPVGWRSPGAIQVAPEIGRRCKYLRYRAPPPMWFAVSADKKRLEIPNGAHRGTGHRPRGSRIGRGVMTVICLV
jgi:hypothetical protein